MPIIVQVKKDKTEKKGAKVSTNLNLAGKFVVLIPNSEFVTISQKIENKEEVKRLTEIVKNIKLKNYGIIIRTSAINATQEQIKDDINEVIDIYNNIIKKSEKEIQNKSVKVKLLYEKGDILKRLLLDIGNQNIDNIIVNNNDTYTYIQELLEINNLQINLKLIEKDNILDMYELEEQIEKLSKRLVWLKCGGFITIDKTEALTAIDVNTGKFIGKENIEKTVLKVNSEATIEIVKQLRMRNLGGIFIIDYIDMDNKEDEKNIQELLIQNLKKDRAKTQVCGFTKLHLLEMTRKQIF
jgi:ribonuclease G